jgi:hypothetical protein
MYIPFRNDVQAPSLALKLNMILRNIGIYLKAHMALLPISTLKMEAVYLSESFCLSTSPYGFTTLNHNSEGGFSMFLRKVSINLQVNMALLTGRPTIYLSLWESQVR